MREFGFELRLCAHLEARGELVARQLGAGVRRPGNRIVDVLVVEPGPGFDARLAITPAAIPHHAIEAAVGAGKARPQRAVVGSLDGHPETAREAIDRAVEIGFLERDRHGRQATLRQVVRYPADWFGRLIGIENKPDLDEPGHLHSQLRHDVALGLLDAVVLATRSHVTGAHRHRLPDEVGIWRFVDGTVEVVRHPMPLAVREPGTEIVNERPGRTAIRTVDAAAKARRRRRLAERAYGKGWRTYTVPGCAMVDASQIDGVGGLPHCRFHDRLVDPATDCSVGCPGYESAEPPDVDLNGERDRTSPWVATPAGRTRQQTGLDRFG